MEPLRLSRARIICPFNTLRSRSRSTFNGSLNLHLQLHVIDKIVVRLVLFGAVVQFVEGRRPRQQGVGTVEFDEHAFVQDGDFVEVEDRVELVRHGDDGVVGELFADDALHQGVGFAVDAAIWGRGMLARC